MTATGKEAVNLSQLKTVEDEIVSESRYLKTGSTITYNLYTANIIPSFNPSGTLGSILLPIYLPGLKGNDQTINVSFDSPTLYTRQASSTTFSSNALMSFTYIHTYNQSNYIMVEIGSTISSDVWLNAVDRYFQSQTTIEISS